MEENKVWIISLQLKSLRETLNSDSSYDSNWIWVARDILACITVDHRKAYSI